MPLDRTWYNTLVDDSGTGTDGTIWNKAQIDNLMDVIDIALASVAILSGVSQDIVFTGNHAIRRNTADGADSGFVTLTGGGSVSQTRGAVITISGNEAGGHITSQLGNVAGSFFRIDNAAGAAMFQQESSDGSLHCISSKSANAWRFNSGHASGSSLAFQRGGVDKGWIGIAEAVTTGYGNDNLEVKATGRLFLEAAVTVDSVTINSTTTAAAANLYIDPTHKLMRSTSSRRYKTDIAPLTDWRFLLDLQPVTFASASTGARHMGLIAEDVAAVEPRLAPCDATGHPDTVAYDHVVAPLIAAVQELTARLAALEARPA